MEFESHVRCSDDQFDAVVSFQMLHNCARPWRLMPELARVCKPGGLVAVVTSMYEKENRHPVDCGRIWPDGLRVLFQDAGLAVEEMSVVMLDTRDAPRKNTVGGVPPADLVGIGRKADEL
jgi:ubiquinone/menaquinone biosynthesis C-methylase UbiE